MDETLLRTLTPAVIGVLVRRGADFAAVEDAVQDALVEAAHQGPVDRHVEGASPLLEVLIELGANRIGPARGDQDARRNVLGERGRQLGEIDLRHRTTPRR